MIELLEQSMCNNVSGGGGGLLGATGSLVFAVLGSIGGLCLFCSAVCTVAAIGSCCGALGGGTADLYVQFNDGRSGMANYVSADQHREVAKYLGYTAAIALVAGLTTFGAGAVTYTITQLMPVPGNSSILT